MDPTVATILGALLGALLTGPVAYYFTKKLASIQKYDSAASKFRAAVIYELTGFFPVDQHWEKKEFHRLYNSIPRISGAAAEFRYFVARKSDFDKAVNAYTQYCREKTTENVFVLDYSKSMPGSRSTKDYMEEFKNIVEHILSFANNS